MPDLTIGDFEIDEDSNGDLVIKDSNDNIVMRWDTGNGNWNFESQTLTNLGSLSTTQASIGQIVAVAALGSDQTVFSSTVTKLNIGTVVSEDSNILTIDTANSQIEFNVSGTFMLVDRITWTSDAGWANGDRFFTGIKLNGSVEGRFTALKAGTDQESAQCVEVVNVTNGDTASFDVFQNSGSSKVVTSGSVKTKFAVARLG